MWISWTVHKTDRLYDLNVVKPLLEDRCTENPKDSTFSIKNDPIYY
jgi:hypothetical protein